MISFFLRKAFAAFGRKYNYDTTYLQEASTIYPAKAWRYLLLTPYSLHRTSASKESYFAAKIASAHIADCGPCTSLCIEMALEAGIDQQKLNLVVLGNETEMSPDILLGYKYAHAIHANSPSLDTLIHEIEIQYGKRGLWDLSTAVAMGDFYPKLKRGLGEAKSCLAPSEIAKEIANGTRKSA
jgi:hypothetical protein